MKKIYILIAFVAMFLFASSTVTKANESTVSAIIKYDLAYPGILPDNPLYKLKVLRDKITTFLIDDPLKKIDFYLLQTDKGILAAAMLIDKNKIKLAGETLLKAENNYTLLTYQFGRIPKKPNSAFFKKLETASLKHQEVIKSLIGRIPENERKTFTEVLEFSRRNLTQVKKYQNQRIFN